MPPNLKIELNETEPHLNLRPSPAWIPTFSLGALFSLILLYSAKYSAETADHGLEIGSFIVIVWESISAVFFFTILVAMWIAFQGNRREFVEAMYSRLFLIGLLVTPASLLGVAYLLEAIGYGAPTPASPGLEIKLAAAILTGEAIVRFASRPKPQLLTHGR